MDEYKEVKKKEKWERSRTSKSRGGFSTGICLRDCKHKEKGKNTGKMCDECVRWSEYEPKNPD